MDWLTEYITPLSILDFVPFSDYDARLRLESGRGNV